LTTTLLARLDGQRAAVIGMQSRDFAALQARYPGIAFVHHAPPMGLLTDQLAFRRARDFAITAAAPFTFLALGSPVQELLAFAIVARRSGTGIGLCIGAGLQFAAGTLPRAPPWMQICGLEWLHRLLHDPLRLATRYLLDDPVVLLDLILSALRRRRT
jgi:exopolysaccharide biosynthesis WecB/TagA/CpsF family protein